MFITNQTAYTYETLLAFNKRHLSFRQPLFIAFFIIAGVLNTLLLITFLAFRETMHPEPSQMITSSLVLAMSIFMVLRFTVIHNRIIRKQAAQNTVTIMHFTEEGFDESSISDVTRQETKSAYSSIIRVTESPTAYYLYIHPQMAHIVSKSGFIEGSEAEFRALLARKIDPKKCRFISRF